MATNTTTTASFQLAMAEAADAIDSEDWPRALKKIAKADVLLQALELERGSQATTSKMRENLSTLKANVKSIGDESNQSAETRRVIRTRTSHG